MRRYLTTIPMPWGLWIGLVTLLMLCLWITVSHGAGNEVSNTLPDSNNISTFRTQSRTFWQNEDAARDAESFPDGFVSSGGSHATSGSCVSTAFATTAYTNSGNRVRAKSDGSGGTVAIDYNTVGANCANPGSDTAYVAICAITGNSTGNWQRASGSNYFINAVDSSPALPSDCAMLMEVTILNGALTAVRDTANHRPDHILLDAAAYSGADAGIKIQAAIAACPSTGCVVDARKLTGPQTISVNVFGSITKPGQLLLGAGTYTFTATQLQPIEPNSWDIIGSGHQQTILQAGATNLPFFQAAAGAGVASRYRVEGLSIKAHAGGSTGAAFDLKGSRHATFSYIGYKSNAGGNYNSLFRLTTVDRLCYGIYMDHVLIQEQTGPVRVAKYEGNGVNQLADCNFVYHSHWWIYGNSGITTIIDGLHSTLGTVEQSVFEDNAGATAVIPGTNWSIERNQFELNTTPILWQSAAGGASNNVTVKDNYFSPWGGSLTPIAGTTGALFLNNVGVGSAVVDLAGDTIVCQGGICSLMFIGGLTVKRSITGDVITEWQNTAAPNNVNRYLHNFWLADTFNGLANVAQLRISKSNVNDDNSTVAICNKPGGGPSAMRCPLTVNADGTIQPLSVTRAVLLTLAPANGSFIFCSDCAQDAACGAGAATALARRLAGSWCCGGGC